MAISSRSDAGFTLLEMLVALAIGAVAAGALAGLSRTVPPRLELTQAAERIAGDFSRARAEARRSGLAVEVRLSEDGYDIAALDLDEAWTVTLVTQPDRLVFQPIAGADMSPASSLVLEHRGARAAIEIAAISGRVHVQILD
jgi:prepilin-type N-terminal cleavage/methylation domain-containing protein